MSEGTQLWNQYCRFYEQDFTRQLEYNTTTLQRYFERWTSTNLAKALRATDAKSINDVPVTTYGDYSIVSAFGERVEQVAKTRIRQPGELLSDYYTRICRELVPDIKDYMVDEFAFATKTSGTTGWNKWIIHGQPFWQNLRQDGIAAILFSCSDEWGSTTARKGDKGLNVVAPVPYISGWGTKACLELFPTIPPIEVTDNEPNMRKKFYLAFQAIERGEQVTLAGGVGSLLYMICTYFLEPENFYREYYESLDFSFMKVGSFLKWLQTRLSRTKVKDIRDLIPLKGITLAGVDARLYTEYFQQQFGIEVFSVYGATEFGEIMWGQPDRKGDLTPNLRSSYWEFQTNTGEIKTVDEVQKGETYSLIGTPFGSILMRYRIDDLVRVIDFRDDGMPLFTFEGRRENIIDVYGYYRLTENIASQALRQAGLQLTDKWAITKRLEPREHLYVLMEKEWDLSPTQASEALFRALQHVFKDFQKYVHDFGIKHSSEAIVVEYLKKGAFLRYSIIQGKKGVPLGQYKPPKIIPPHKAEIYETLRMA